MFISNYIIKKYKLLLTIIFFFSPIMCGEVATESQQPADTGGERLKKVRSVSLEREQKRQKKVALNIDQRTLAEIEEQKGPDTFTQTEAYFQIPDLREAVTKTFQVVPYMSLVSRIMANEGRLRNTHWAFYHTTSNVWRVVQDLYTELYYHFNPKAPGSVQEFQFLRFNDEEGGHAKEFLMKELSENGLVDDNGDASAFLLSVNLSPFGNTGFPSECSWRYFIKEKQHKVPDRSFYEDILKKFELGTEYVDELMSLVDLLSDTKEQTMLQIFVPKDIVDDVAYLAWATGIPAYKEAIDWVRTNVKNKVYRGKEKRPAALWALDDLQERFKNEQEKNPMFREMMQRIQEGDYSVNSFLKIYTNKPWELPNLNYAQARLVFSKEYLLDPASGIKMYRHTTIRRRKLTEYQRRLDEIIKKIVATKSAAAA